MQNITVPLAEKDFFTRFYENDLLCGGIVLMLMGIFAAVLKTLLQELYRKAKEQFVVSLEVSKEDPSYWWIMQWISSLQSSQKARSITLFAHKKGHRVSAWSRFRGKTPSLAFAPAPGLHVLSYKGKTIYLTRIIDDNPTKRDERHESLSISTFGRSTDILKDLAGEAMRFALNLECGKTLIFTASRSGEEFSWTKSKTKTRRPFHSVFLDSDLAEELYGDAKEFLDSKDWYEDRGIPHRRGWLLYGPPGCGKSSFVRALASRLDLAICILSLSTERLDDDNLNRLLEATPDHSVVLLEDIDAAFCDRKEGKEKGNNLSFSGLLNALDGAAAQEGSLIFMTTNHKEKLDPALIRPGRVDRKVYIGLASLKQIRKMFLYFYFREKEHLGEELADAFVAKLPDETLPMARIQGFLLNYKHDPNAAVENAEQLLKSEEECVVVRKNQSEDEDGDEEAASAKATKDATAA